MFKNGALKLSYIGSTTKDSFKLLSLQTPNVGKDISIKFNDVNPKPIVIPNTEPMPSSPHPTVPYPTQVPVIEVPGPIAEPSLPQSYPQNEPVPGTKPPIEIPVPNKTASSHKDMEANNEEDVLIKDFGNTGIITLNRPKALNSLNLSMIEKIYPTLKKWETSKKLVVIEGAGEKAFCAGGDVKAIGLVTDENKEFPQTFFKKEYTQNHLIGTYKIPYVALMNGITMGGGVGLSVHGKYRVATEKTLFAMPETAIGLFPDVGGSYFLPRLQGKLGVYLGLTGERLKGIDVLHAGIATHIVPSKNLTELKQDLLTTEFPDVTTILNKYQLKNFDEQFALAPYMKQIDRCFSASSVEEIIKRLEEDKSEWAEKTIKTLSKMSPTSLKITLLAIKKGSTLNLAECLKMEYRLACNLTLCKTTDFYEGVRAVLIDKDQNPKWNPNNLSEVSDAYVNKQFANFPQGKDLLL